MSQVFQIQLRGACDFLSTDAKGEVLICNGCGARYDFAQMPGTKRARQKFLETHLRPWLQAHVRCHAEVSLSA